MDAEERKIMRDLEQRHDAWIVRVFAANDDLRERAAAFGINVQYDAEDDTLLLTVGAPRDAATESINNQILVRYDPDTLKIWAMEILDVKTFDPGNDRLGRFIETAMRDPGGAGAHMRDLAMV